VVNISSRGRVKVENPLMESPFFNDPFFRRFFGEPDMPQYQEMQSLGSGVIVDSAKGYVLTNAHVVKGAEEVRVTLMDDREFKAKVVGVDDDTDIAVLKINADRLTAINLGDSDRLQVGDFVVAIGNPFGLHQTVTSGIISALGRSGIGNPDQFEDFIQTDASINPGNSGGALVDMAGRLVGVNTAILSQSGGNIGIGFAIPVNITKQVMDQIIKYGKINRGRLGVIVQNLTPDLAKALKLNLTQGVVVTKVQPGTPAAKAGLKAGDVIVGINGRKVESYRDLRNTIGLLRVGDPLSLDVVRGGSRETIRTSVGAAPQEQAQVKQDLNPRLAGAVFAERGGGRPGIVVKDVQPNSPAAIAGLLPGDLISAVNQQPVNSLEEFKKMIKGQETLLLTIQRGDGALFLIIK
jgi:serine protease Do/serine protease DegQ